MKFTLATNIKENYYKMLYRCYMTPVLLSKIYKNGSTKCWKCKLVDGTFYHLWWTCAEVKKYWINIHKYIRKITKLDLIMKPELYLLNILDTEIVKESRILLLYMISAARIIYA